MGRMRALSVFLVLGILSLPTIADARSLYFGISANSRSRGEIAQDRAAETGVNRLREDLEWWRVEPSKGEWTWSETDAMYRSAAERGMTILPIPNSPPCWAVPAGTPKCEAFPVTNQDYATFVGKVATRYGPGGDFWKLNPDLDGALASRYIEIWNEPYWGVGEEPVNPPRYAALYKAAVIAGRAANPATRYLIESTVGGQGGVNWAAALKTAEPAIGSYIDGLAVHPYPGSHDITYQPQSVTDEAFINVQIDYERWLAQGIKKPVWITEIGYSSCADGAVHCVPGSTQAARETRKAEWLAQLLDEIAKDKYGFVHALYLYNLEQWNSATTPTSQKSAWYGLLYAPMEEHLPAWSSFALAVAKYDGPPIPTATITDRTLTGPSTSFSFTSTDPTASFECQLDEGSWSSCTSPKAYIGVGGGSHLFKVRAVNAEATSSPASYSWSNIYLRPNGDKAKGGWSVTGAASAWDALNDNVTQLQAPSFADYVTYVGGLPSTLQVNLEDPVLGGSVAVGATAWFYPNMTPTKMTVRSVTAPLGPNTLYATVNSKKSEWTSVAIPLSGVSPFQPPSLTSLNLGFEMAGLGPEGASKVYATFVQLAVEP